MIAHEFNMQDDHLRPSSMPLLAMARTAVDIDFNDQLRILFWNQALSFLEFDTVLFREEQGSKLYNQQEEKLRPQIETFEKMFKVKLPTNFGFEAKQFKKEDKEKIEKYVTSLNSWELISIQQMGGNSAAIVFAKKTSNPPS